MLFSYKELKRLASLTIETKVEDVVKAINSIGFEVEEYNKFADVEGIKFGLVESIKPNPNADKLFICDIKFDDKNRIIQTNATNVKEGMIVIAFVPGSRSGEVTFDAKELQGVVSEGMLSSPAEFGIDKEYIRESIHAGIASYPEVKDLSINPIEYLELDDYIIDVSILSNRSDAASYLVMAKEIAAYFGTNPIKLNVSKPTRHSEIEVSNGKARSLVMLETKVPTISIKEQIFLAKHKVKGVNNAADLSNLVLLYAGQPTHAYDMNNVGKAFKAAKVSGNVKVFGDKEVRLDNDLVITDENGHAICVASVVGIESHKTTRATEEAILEMGIFNIKDVRKAVKSVKLNTDASNQGSKVLSIGTTFLALEYLASRLEEYAAPVNFVKPEVRTIKFDEKKINMYAGENITSQDKYKQALKSLETLGFVFEGNQVTIPNYRHDISMDQDIIEEVFRFYGYDHFKPKAPAIKTFKVKNQQDEKVKVSAMGYKEVRTYSLLSKAVNQFNPFRLPEVALETFVSKEREVIRYSQALSLLEVIEYNQKRGMKDVSIFSKGQIASGDKSLALATTEKTLREVQQDIVNLVGDVTFSRVDGAQFHHGVSAWINKENETIGYVGKVHPLICKVDAYVAEIFVPKTKTKATYVEFSQNPLKFEDVNIVSQDDIGSEVEKFKGDNVFDISVVDEYSTEDERKVTVRIIKED